MLISLVVVVISQCIWISKHIVQPNYTTFIYHKNWEKESNYLSQLGKEIYRIPTANIILSSEKLNTRPLWLGTRKMCFLTTPSCHKTFSYMKNSYNNKKYTDWKKKEKKNFFSKLQDCWCQKPHITDKKTPGINKWILEGCRIQC